MQFRRHPRLVAVGAVAAGLVLGLPLPAAQADQTTPSAKAVAAARAAAAQRAADVGKAQAQLALANAKLDQLNTAAEVVIEAYNGAMVKLAKAQQASDLAKAQLAAAQRRTQEQRREMGQFAAASYRTGGDLGTISVLLDSDGPAAFVERIGALDQLGKVKAQAFDRMRAAQIVQHVAERAAGEALAEVTKASDAAAKAKQAAQQAVAQQQTQVVRLDTLRAGLEQQLAAAQSRATTLSSQRAAGLAREAAARKAREEAARRAREEAARKARESAAPPSSGGASSPPPASGGVSRSTAAQGLAAVRAAEKWLGTPYCWGGGNAYGPTQGDCAPAAPGFDCSGLTLYAWAQAGISLDHWTGYQWDEGEHIPVSAARPGDLFFYATDTSDPNTIHHVGLYAGNGQMIEAPYTGASVRYASPYRSDLIGVVRP